MAPSQKRAALAARLIKAGEAGEPLAACFSPFDRAVVLGWLMVLYDRDGSLRRAMDAPTVKEVVPVSFWVDVKKGKEKAK